MGDIWTNFILLITQALVALYGVVGNYGIAIIIFTVVVRLIFLPLSIKSTKSMRQMQEQQARLKPQMQALQKKYGNDRQKLMEEQNKLYQEHGINPMSGLGGCLPMLIQMPLWIALYQALFHLSGTAEFAAPFLWIANLGQKEGAPYILTAFTGITQWITQRMMATPSTDPQQKTMNNMTQIMMPAMIVFFAFNVPAGLVLYWATSNVFQFVQQYFTTGWGGLFPSKNNQPAVAAAASTKKEESKEAKDEERERQAQARAERKEQQRERQEQRKNSNGGSSEDGRWQPGSAILDDASSAVRNGIRVYTLEPDGNGLSAEGSSQTMEESIERVKDQMKPRRKKRKG